MGPRLRASPSSPWMLVRGREPRQTTADGYDRSAVSIGAADMRKWGVCTNILLCWANRIGSLGLPRESIDCQPLPMQVTEWPTTCMLFQHLQERPHQYRHLDGSLRYSKASIFYLFFSILFFIAPHLQSKKGIFGNGGQARP